MTFPEMCRDARVGLGCTLRDVSEATGLSKSCIHHIENYGIEPKAGTLVQLMYFYGFDWFEAFDAIEATYMEAK